MLFAFIAQCLKDEITKQFFVILVILSITIPAGIRDVIVEKDTCSYIRAIQIVISS